MIAKYWKKIGMLILIIACIFNVMTKLVKRVSLNKEMISSATYMVQHSNENKTKK